MAQCPQCRRPVAMVRPTCVYCGAPLPTEAIEEAARSAEAATAPAPTEPGTRRRLLILDLANASEAAVASGLGLSAFEAGQRLKRGGLQLYRIADEREADEEAEALRASGLEVVVVPEEEARLAPLPALGGAPESDGLRLRMQDGSLGVRREELLLVVRGPIVRQYPASLQIRRLQIATLEGGYRIHLHRRADPQPVELDPGNFEFGVTLTGSSLLELLDWLEAAAAGVPVDDSFRRLPPVLSPGAPTTSGVMAATGGLVRPARRSSFGADEAPAELDNVAQFRFYSGWRAAVERRRTG